MKLLRFIFLGLIIILNACDTPKYLSVPIDYNPKLSFKSDTTTILLINRFDFNTLRITNKRKLSVLKSGAFTSVKYAERQLGQLPHIRIIKFVDSVTFKTTTDSIKLLALQYHSDYVLALTGFGSDISLSEVQNSTAYYNSSALVEFTLYESNGIYSKKLRGTISEPQSSNPYPGLIGSLIIHPTVGGNPASVNSSVEHATQSALQDYLPYTINNVRPLYNDDLLQPMVREIIGRHFDKAYLLAGPLLIGSDLKIASKAAYNLAVVYEAQGDIDLAINFAQQSLDKSKNTYAATILEDLKAE